MKAAFYRRTGAAHDVLEVGELPVPEPGAGEVRVRLHVSGINPTDVKSRAGFRGKPVGFEHQVPGQDGAGAIDKVGDGVEAARNGQRVWVFHGALGRPSGTSAQYIVVPDWQAVPLGEADFQFGAALGIPFMTAHRCLLRDGLIEGQTVLIAGGAGAVGNAAIQIAKRHGARTITTVSTEEKAELAAAAGADHVIVGYDRPGAADEIRSHAPDGVDRIVELALTTNLELDLAVLRQRGTIVTYSTEPTEPTVPVGRLMYAGQRLDFMLIYLEARSGLEEAADYIAAAVDEGALTPLPAQRLPLDKVAAAHTLVESGPTGRVLLDIP